MNRHLSALFASVSFLIPVAAGAETASREAELLIEFPTSLNSPASMALDAAGNLYVTSPNFHSEALIEAGKMEAPAAPAIARLDSSNTLETWYTFTEADMEPTSGLIGPFGIAFGPDGNAYLADMQLWFGGTSRILRIKVEDGKAVGVETVVSGTSFPNALVWRGDDLFLSDTVLAEGEDGTHISGLYKFNISELDPENPVVVTPYGGADNADPHLFETFVSNGSLKFGANGLTVDGAGNLYTSIMEDGNIIKTMVDETGELVGSEVFAEGMKALDGMSYDPATDRIYVTDLFLNAVYAIDMDGTVELLAQNGDTDGSGGKLDAPAEVIVRGNEAIVTNFDAVFPSPDMRNTAADLPITLSVIRLD